MITDETIKKHSYGLLLLTVVFSALSITVNYLEEEFYSRLLRSIITISFLAYFIFFKKRKISQLLILFFSLYFFSNFMAIWYEVSLVPSLLMGLLSIASVSLTLYLLPKIKGVKANTSFKVILSAIVLINLGLLLELIYKIKFTEKEVSYNLYIIMILFVFIVCINSFATLLYNYHKSSRVSIVFTMFWFSSVFSEVFRGLSHYDIGFSRLATYLEQIIFCISLSLLVFYAILNYQEKKLKKSEFRYL